MTYSATLPKEVTGLIEDKIGDDYTTLHVEKQEVVVDTVDHMFMHLETKRKYDVLEHLLRTNEGLKTVVFVERKVSASDLAWRLEKDGFAVDALHGDMEQRDRFKTLKRIKNNEINVLVATDVAAR